MNIVFFGLAITSSWGNGHARTYRSLLRALSSRGHSLAFLERDRPLHAAHRDLPAPTYARVHLYASLEELEDHLPLLRAADVVVLGSFVPDVAKVGDFLIAHAPGKVAFYDIDTPVTLSRLGSIDYLRADQIARFALYLSAAGGPSLALLEQELGSPCARAFFTSVDASAHFPERSPALWDLGYVGAYSAEVQPVVEEHLLRAARSLPGQRFTVVGGRFPASTVWPGNVEHREHLHVDLHRRFYACLRYALCVTSTTVRTAGWCPSSTMLEAAACGTPVISDDWPGLEQLLVPGEEVLVARSTGDVIRILAQLDDGERVDIGRRARARVLGGHTSRHRAEQFENHAAEALAS